MKFEYNGRWLRIVVELFHRELPFSRRKTVLARDGEDSRRRMLRKVIHKIGEPSA